MADRQRFQDISFGRGEIERHLFEPKGTVHLLKRIELEAVDILQADIAQLDIADSPDGRGHRPSPSQQRIRDVEEHFSLLNGSLDGRLAFRPEADGAEKGGEDREYKYSFHGVHVYLKVDAAAEILPNPPYTPLSL